MSCDLERCFHSPWEVRGHFSRRALPCWRLSALVVPLLDFMLDSPDRRDSVVEACRQAQYYRLADVDRSDESRTQLYLADVPIKP